MEVRVDGGPWMQEGDKFTMDSVEFRKWWQFWKKRHWAVRRTFVVTSVGLASVD